jgi:DNA-binding NtrC family response regulator
MRKKILVVDDDKNVREVTEAMLLYGNYNTDRAENGKEALEKLAEEKYDGIVSDIDMPIINGIEMSDELEKRGKNYPILFLSGRVENEELISYSGRYEFMSKPYDMDRFLESVNRLFKGASLTNKL